MQTYKQLRNGQNITIPIATATGAGGAADIGNTKKLTDYLVDFVDQPSGYAGLDENGVLNPVVLPDTFQIQFRRGTQDELDAYVLAAGEPGWDGADLRVGDGTTPGGWVIGGAGAAAQTLTPDDLNTLDCKGKKVLIATGTATNGTNTFGNMSGDNGPIFPGTYVGQKLIVIIVATATSTTNNTNSNSTVTLSFVDLNGTVIKAVTVKSGQAHRGASGPAITVSNYSFAELSWNGAGWDTGRVNIGTATNAYILGAADSNLNSGANSMVLGSSNTNNTSANVLVLGSSNVVTNAANSATFGLSNTNTNGQNAFTAGSNHVNNMTSAATFGAYSKPHMAAAWYLASGCIANVGDAQMSYSVLAGSSNGTATALLAAPGQLNSNSFAANGYLNAPAQGIYQYTLNMTAAAFLLPQGTLNAGTVTAGLATITLNNINFVTPGTLDATTVTTGLTTIKVNLSAAGTVPNGTSLTIAGNAQAYATVGAAVANGSNQVTLTITPGLAITYAAAAKVSLSCILENQLISYVSGAGTAQNYTVAAAVVIAGNSATFGITRFGGTGLIAGHAAGDPFYFTALNDPTNTEEYAAWTNTLVVKRDQAGNLSYLGSTSPTLIVAEGSLTGVAWSFAVDNTLKRVNINVKGVAARVTHFVVAARAVENCLGAP